MANNLFREKNVEKVASPDNLDAFLRVTNPSMWIAFAAIVVLLIGGLVWSFTGTIESKVNAVIVSNDKGTTCYVSEKNVADLKEGMTVRVGTETYKLTGGSPNALLTSITLSDYAMQLGGFQDGEYVYALTLDKNLEPGNYKCEIVLETMHPIDFLK